MANGPNRTGWGARLLIAVALILVGAAGAAWALARYDQAARFLGVTPQLETRLARVERSTQRVEGSAGRADALLVAFAARRAIDRGVALGFLEPLLLDRFGETHARAVATVVTGSHSPVQLADLVSEYRALGPMLRSSAPEEGVWSQFQRELGSLIQIRRTDRPSTQPDARYLRALAELEDGEVDAALAETMRLPGAPHAQGWIRKARQYVAVHRALDEIETAALLGRSAAQPS